jgi:tetratricopeptide (TPR) repeat protein
MLEDEKPLKADRLHDALPGKFGRYRLAAPLVLILVATIPYLETRSHGFINFDDQSGIVRLDLIRHLSLESLPDFFRLERRPGLQEYMPLKFLSYAVDYALFGLSAPGFRLQQMFWYLLSVLLFWFWLRRLSLELAEEDRLGLPRQWAAPVALTAALFFAVHPAHVESVTWLSGRKDVLSGALMLGALLAALKWPGFRAGVRGAQHGYLGCALVCEMLALLAKPVSVMLPLLFVFQDLVRYPRQRWLPEVRQRAYLYLASAVLAAILVYLYTSVTLGLDQGIQPEAQWRAFEGPGWLRWGQQIGAFLWIGCAPGTLTPLYPGGLMEPTLLSLEAAGGLVLLALAVFCLFWSLWRGHPLALGVGLFVLPLVPVLLFPVNGQYFAGRYLFHAVGGVAFAVAWVLAAVARSFLRLKWFVLAMGSLWFLTLGVSTFMYNKLWSDGLALWRSVVAVYPDFTEAHLLAPRAAFRQDEKKEARLWLERCIAIDPTHANCTAVLAEQVVFEDPAAAEALLRGVLAHDRVGDAHAALAKLYGASGRAREGADLYERFLGARPVAAEQMSLLALLRSKAGQPDKALVAAQHAVKAAAVNLPGQPPPVDTLLEVARANGDSRLRERVQRAARMCKRSDCFRRALGW